MRSFLWVSVLEKALCLAFGEGTKRERSVVIAVSRALPFVQEDQAFPPTDSEIDL
jgi:hypothetical protein